MTAARARSHWTLQRANCAWSPRPSRHCSSAAQGPDQGSQVKDVLLRTPLEGLLRVGVFAVEQVHHRLLVEAILRRYSWRHVRTANMDTKEGKPACTQTIAGRATKHATVYRTTCKHMSHCTMHGPRTHEQEATTS